MAAYSAANTAIGVTEPETRESAALLRRSNRHSRRSKTPALVCRSNLVGSQPHAGRRLRAAALAETVTRQRASGEVAPEHRADLVLDPGAPTHQMRDQKPAPNSPSRLPPGITSVAASTGSSRSKLGARRPSSPPPRRPPENVRPIRVSATSFLERLDQRCLNHQRHRRGSVTPLHDLTWRDGSYPRGLSGDRSGSSCPARATSLPAWTALVYEMCGLLTGGIGA